MSKPPARNSWKFIEDRCKAAFGPGRVSSDEMALRIKFDLAKPLQHYEHDTLLLSLTRNKIEPGVSINDVISEGKILVPVSTTVELMFDKDDINPDQFNAILLPLIHKSQVKDTGEVRYKSSPVINKLEEITEVPWTGVMPNPYTETIVYTPTQQHSVTENLRREQEGLLVAGFVPEHRHPKVVAKQLVEQQAKVETRKGLPPKTAIPDDIIARFDDRARLHLDTKLADKGYVRAVRESFNLSGKKERE